MALTEITKGMSNAAEAINGNFAKVAEKGSGVNNVLQLTNDWIGTVRWRKNDGNVVTIEVDVGKNSTITPLNDIATLPASIRTFEKALPVVSTVTGEIEFLYINAGGILRTPAKTTMRTDRTYHGVITYTI